MEFLSLIWSKFTPSEKKLFIIFFLIIVTAAIADTGIFINEKGEFIPIEGGVYKEGVIGQPININPILSSKEVDLKISAFLFSPLSQFIKNINISEDGKIYTLELKDNLKWSDGKDITSDDLIFTIEKIQDFNSNSPLYDTWKGIKIERISSIQTKIYLPNPNFLFQKSIESLRIIPQHIFDAVPTQNIILSDYRLKPISSGPYKFLKFNKRKDGFITTYTLTTNSYYSGEKPFIKKVEFIFFENIEEVKEALKMHKINGFVYFPTAQNKIEEIKGYFSKTIPVNTYYALFFNEMANNYLKNSSFRKALIASIDKEKIRDCFPRDNSQNLPAISFVAEQENEVSYNLSFAQNIISQIKNKSKTPLVLTITTPEVESLKSIAEIIKTSWLAAGIDEINIVTENFNDPSTSPLKTKNYEILLFGNSLENYEDLLPFWHSSSINYPGLNIASYQNPKTDSLLEKIREEKNIEERKILLNETIKSIVSNHPAVFLSDVYCSFIFSSYLSPLLPSNIYLPSDIYQNFNKWTISKVRVINFQK